MKLMNPAGFTEKIYVQFCNKTAVSGAQLFRDGVAEDFSPCDRFGSADSERPIDLPDAHPGGTCPHGPGMLAGFSAATARQETARRRRIGIRERVDRFN